MPLSSGLFNSQDQNEEALLHGPGVTIDDQKPSLFGNFAGAIPRGIGQGVAEGISMLTHGLSEDAIPALMKGNPFASILSRMDQDNVDSLPGVKTAKEIPGALDEASISTRNVAQDLVGDPRTTGTASNVVQGFAKAATEFTVGSAVGGPVGGASLMGASEGYSHYLDLRDQGVDKDTAERSGLLTAVASGGSALLPMSMPAKWLAGLSTPGVYLAQGAAGAAINTTFGTVSRYGSAKILDDAGYPEMAAQQKPIDAENMLVDAISGAFFGAHAAFHGIKAKDIDPSILDAAKVVQDRQEIAERAPGSPVDVRSQAVHRELLESSLNDLLHGRDVDNGHIDSEGAGFAHGDIDESHARDIIREEFVKSGVLDTASAFDRWARGEDPVTPKEVAAPKPEEAPKGEAPTFGKELTPEEDQAQRSTGPAETALASRPDLQIADENGVRSAADAHAQATEAEAQANKEAEPMHEAAVACEARHA